MNHLTQNYGVDPEVTNLVDNREIWFILMVNPDGYAYNDQTNPTGGGMWRKNRRDNGDGTYGVDLNRNYGYMWGYDDIGSSPNTATETYRGPGPFSEAENQALRDFIIAHHFEIVINYHAFSNLIIWPYGYEVGTYTPDERVFNALGQRLSSYNNYTADPSWTMYPVNGDANDWSYGEQTLKEKCFGYTIEAGNYFDGFWPPVSRIPEIVAENLPGSLFLISLVGDVNSITPPEKPSLISPDSILSGGSYSIEWALYDTVNPPVNYELLEMQEFRTGTDSAANFDAWINNGYTLSSDVFHSSPSSFYSGSPSLAYRFIQSTTPYLVKPNDTLKFWTNYLLLENWDFAWVEVSMDGETFFSIPGNLTTNNNYIYHNRGHGITGSSGGNWVEGLFDLSNFVGQKIFVRFSYKDHDLSFEGPGIYIDDISPISSFETTTVLSSSLTDTSYAISGRPDGVYYYKVRAMDQENQWGIFSDIGQTTVGFPYFCGDANGDKVVNIKDITYLINYLYKGGPIPDPIQAGDANGDGIMNIKDVTYLINFLYKEGAIPVCPPN
jgi:Zinc carboxypeptidase/Immune inhibitor A-like, MAM domain/Dockerin type I domain